MALDNIHLRKLLKILFLDQGPRRTALRGDIREEIAKEAGKNGGRWRLLRSILVRC